MRKKTMSITALFVVILAFVLVVAGCTPKEKTFSITLDLGEGQTQVLELSGEISVAPVPSEKEGYEFEGWYTDATYSTPVQFPLKLSENMTLYAKYLKQYKLTLVSAGSDNKESMVAKVDTMPTITREGYTFAGWYFDSAYTKEFTVPYVLEEDTVLYAKWTKESGEEYVVKFFTDGGSPVEDFKGSVIETAPVSTKEGYTLKGWGTSASRDTVVKFPLTLTKSMTLYAKWEEIGGGESSDYIYVNEYRDAKESLKAIFDKETQDGDMFAINIATTITTAKGTASVDLKANLAKDGGNELMFKVTMLDVQRTAFAFYVIGNNIYVDLGQGTPVLHLTDLKPDYIVAFLGDTISGLDLEELLNSLGSSIGLDIAGILVNLIFDPPYYTSVTRIADNILLSEQYNFEIKLNSLVEGVSNLLGMIDLGGILGFDIKLTPLFDWLNATIPQLKVYLSFQYQHDETLGATVLDTVSLVADDNNPENDVEGEVFSWVVDTIEAGSTHVDINIPEEALAQTQEFSLSNLQFDIDLNIYTKGEGIDSNNGLDVAKLVNLFAPDLGLPENVLILNAEFGYRIKAMVDLDLNYENSPEDKNLIALEIYPIDASGNIITTVPMLLGMYYYKGAMYVSFSEMMPEYWKAKNIRIDNVNLDGVLSYVVELVTSAIDKQFGSNWGDYNGSAQGLNLSTNDKIELTLGEDEQTGEVKVIVSPTIQQLITAVASAVGFEEAVYATDDQIVVELNSKLFDAINQFMKNNPIQLPIALDGKLALNLFEGGLESVEINATVGVPDKDENGENVVDENGNIVTSDPVDVSLKMHNFLLGFKQTNFDNPDIKSLDQYIASKIGDGTQNHESNLGALLDSILGGIDINAHVNIGFNKGTYAIGKFLEGMGLEALKDVPLEWTFSNDFSFNVDMSIMVIVDKTSKSNSKFAIELKALEDIILGESIGMPKDSVIFGVYGFYKEDGSGNLVPNILIDMTSVKIMNITLPKLSFEFDYVQTLVDLFGSIKIGDTQLGDFDIAFDISSLFGGSQTSEAQAMNALFTSTDGTAQGTELSDFGQIIFGLNAEKIYAQTTIAAVGKLLSQVGVDLNGFDLSKIDLGVSLDVSRLNGFTLEASGELIPPEQAGTLQELVLKMEIGTPEYPLMVGDIRKDLLNEKIDAVKAQLDSYTSDLIKAIVDTVGVAELSVKMDLTTSDNHIDFAKIINNILIAEGQYLDLPIDLYLDDWQSLSYLNVKWDLDLENPLNSKLLVEFLYEEKLIISIGIANGDLVINLEGLGLFAFKLTNSNLVSLIMGMLDDMIAKIGNLDLTEIINGLLKPSAQGSEEATISETASALAMANGQTKDDSSQSNDATMDLIMMLLKGVSASDASLFVNITAQTFEDILVSLLGISLGFDINANLGLDMVEGDINLGIDLSDVVDFDSTFSIKIGKDATSQGGVTDWEVDTTVPDINAQNGEVFAETLLDRLNIALSIDILNNNILTGGSNSYLRLSVEKLSTQRILANTKDNKVAPAGSFLATLLLVNSQNDFDNSLSTASTSPLVYIVLEYKADMMHIYLAQNQIELVVDLGDYVAISTNMDLVGMLAPMLQGLIDQIDAVSSAQTASENSEEVAMALPMATTDGTTTEPSPFAEIFANFDILKLLSGGIDIRLTSAGVFNVNASLDPYVFNKLIDDVMNLLFGPNTILNLAELAPTMFGTNYLAKVNWDRVYNDGSGFWQTLKSQLTPMLKEVVTNMVSSALAPLITDTLLNGVYGKVEDIIKRILPFPVFNQIDVGVNVLDGTFSNLYIKGYDYNQAVVDENGNNLTYTNASRTIEYSANSRSAAYKTEIYIFNKSDSIGNENNTTGDGSQGVVDWGDLKLTANFDPYEYSSDPQTAYNDFFNEYFANKTAKYQYKTTVQKANVTFTMEDGSPLSLEALDLIGNSNNNILSEPIQKTVIASASFASGVKTLPITVNIYPLSSIKSVEPIEAHAYDDLVDEIIINLNNGSQRKVSTSTMNGFEYSPDTYLAHEKDVDIKFANGVNAKLHVNYLDSTVVDIIGSANEANTLEVDMYQFTEDNRTIERFTPDYLYVFYPDGSTERMKVDNWEVSEEVLKNITQKASTDVSMINDVITATVASDSGARQVIELALKIKTKKVTALGLGSTLDSLEINPYDYYLQKIGYSTQGILPSQAVAYYYEEANGMVQSYNEQVYVNINITTDGENYFDETLLTYDSSGTYGGNVSLNTAMYGDRYNVDPTTEGYDSLAPGYFTWSKDITVNVVSNVIDKVYFDAELTQEVFTVNAYEFNAMTDAQKQAYFPKEAYVKFMSGAVRKMPIQWKYNGALLDPAALEVDYETYTEQYVVEIGYAEDAALQDKFLQNTMVSVVVDGNKIKEIDIAGFGEGDDKYQINPINVLYLGQSAFPSTVNVVYENGETGVINVYKWDEVDVTMTGGASGVVNCMLTADGKNTYQIRYEVLKKGQAVYVGGEIVVDPFSYTTQTNSDGTVKNVFAEFGKQIEVYFADYENSVSDSEEKEVETYLLNVSKWTYNVVFTPGATGTATAYIPTANGSLTELVVDVKVKDVKRVEGSTNIAFAPSYFGENFIPVIYDRDNDIYFANFDESIRAMRSGETLLTITYQVESGVDELGNIIYEEITREVTAYADFTRLPMNGDDLTINYYYMEEAFDSPANQLAQKNPYNVTMTFTDGSGITYVAQLPAYVAIMGTSNANSASVATGGDSSSVVAAQ